MPRHAFDKSSKWLLEHYTRGVLLLGGMRDVRAARTRQAEVVQPRQLPDGLIEIELKGHKKPHYVVVEVETYASKKVEQQAVDDLMLVYQDKGVLPELLVVVLRPKGKIEVSGEREEKSLLGSTSFGAKWQVEKLWEKPAAELLAANDVGVVPWVPLTRFEGRAEDVLKECRERIERQARPEHQLNLLAVTQVLAGLRYPASRLLEILGGRKVMIESPILKKLMAEASREGQQRAIVRVLRRRFGTVPDDLVGRLQAVDDQDQLDDLVDQAATCSSLEAFRKRLSAQGR